MSKGWSALQEAIVRHYQPLAWAKWCRRLPCLVGTRRGMRDFCSLERKPRNRENMFLKEKMASGEELSNREIILKNYVIGFPKDTNMEIVSSSIKLKVPEGSNSILVKNLTLSCDL
ncbi:hypothetical protein AMTR_s00069p00172120 [Amborella trichopoda]|uniref:Uncharacterized protein n=1 Tax=Amborella trichopoda TaxID=13333 RepID=U5DB16_AMBTC|nr:hypothetical protein AMTR_s00069p00172120 [Amborella trichopoda]